MEASTVSINPNSKNKRSFLSSLKLTEWLFKEDKKSEKVQVSFNLGYLFRQALVNHEYELIDQDRIRFIKNSNSSNNEYELQIKGNDESLCFSEAELVEILNAITGVKEGFFNELEIIENGIHIKLQNTVSNNYIFEVFEDDGNELLKLVGEQFIFWKLEGMILYALYRN